LSPLLVIAIILWAISGVGLVVMIMLHSGKGTGISDILASSLSGNMGTTIVEKNLDRITVILAIVFFAMIFLMMVIYPH
jgi:preprotein translocase subunit SecG